MKFLFILLTFFSLNYAFADVEGCSGFYAATLEDIFTGRATQFSDKEILAFGTETKDDFFGLSIGADDRRTFNLKLTSPQVDGSVYLEETVLNSMVSLFSTANLVGKLQFPSGVFGASEGAVYLVFMCVR